MLRQWNSRSELCVTTLSRMRAFGLATIQRVTVSPSSSRSLIFVAVKTLAPIMAALLDCDPVYPLRAEHVKKKSSATPPMGHPGLTGGSVGDLFHPPSAEDFLETLLGRPLEVEVRDSIEKAMKILKQKM